MPAPETRLVFVALRVRDLEQSVRFYRDALAVPLELSRADIPGEPVHAEVSWREGAYLHFALFPGGPANGIELSFYVDDLEVAHRRAVAAGATVVHEPRDQPWGRTASYADPDGNLVALTQRARPLRVAGVDLARGAWAVVVLEGDRVVDAFRCESFAEALLVDAQVVAVDIPIGVPEAEPRAADAAARKFVGARASSVFATPLRSVLEARTYPEALDAARRLTGQGISKQAYALRDRILEVDEYASADERVIEVHPEVSFSELARRPLQSKHTSGGLAERRALLEEAGIAVPPTAPRIAEPDLLDATVAAWTARRYARGEALPLPEGQRERLGTIWR
jgi:predicted RNase H-like nuclease/predicted enzyme related to lactoylglutathione lyase